MKRYLLTLSLISTLFLLASCGGKCPLSGNSSNEKVLRHVVMFGFNPELPANEVQTIEKAFENLPSQISEVKGFEWGTDCSPEGLQKGLTHCFLLSFDSEKDRDAYLVHPAHKEFGKLINGKLSAVTVVDYWTK